VRRLAVKAVREFDLVEAVGEILIEDLLALGGMMPTSLLRNWNGFTQT